MVSFFNQRELEQRRRDDDDELKHSKQIYSGKKKEKSKRVRSRRVNDLKHSNQEHLNNDKLEDNGFTKCVKTAKSNTSTLKLEEFPPMQTSSMNLFIYY